MNLLSQAARLSDRDLLAHVKDLAQREREATVALIAHLAELDDRRLHLAEGYPSLFKYCTDVLHLSEHAAYNRIQAARAVRRFPMLLEHLAEGGLNLFTLRLLAPHLTPENHRDLLSLALHKSRPEMEELIARLRPQPPVPDAVRKLPTRTNAASKATELLAATAPPDATALPDTAALAPARGATISPLAPERYKIQFMASAPLRAKLREAQALLRHQIPDGDLEKVFDRALEALLTHLRRQKLAAAKWPRQSRSRGSDAHATSSATRSFGPGQGSRHIPAEVKRAVWERDGERCAFVSANGRRCAEDGFLEFHHVVPFAHGGQSSVDNIELRCRARNGYEAERHFGRRATAAREDAAVYGLQTVTVNATTVRGDRSANSFWTDLEHVRHARRFSEPGALGATRQRTRVCRAASKVGMDPKPPPARRTARSLYRVSSGRPSYPDDRRRSGRPRPRTAGESGQRFPVRARGAAALGRTRRPRLQNALGSRRRHCFCHAHVIPRRSRDACRGCPRRSALFRSPSAPGLR